MRPLSVSLHGPQTVFSSPCGRAESPAFQCGSIDPVGFKSILYLSAARLYTLLYCIYLMASNILSYQMHFEGLCILVEHYEVSAVTSLHTNTFVEHN